MMKSFVFAACLILLIVGHTANAQENSSPFAKLANIHKIYIDHLGTQEGADLVREKIRVRLVKSGRFSVVERPESADAVLTGAAGTIRSYEQNTNGQGSTSFQGSGVLRLVNAKTDEVIWIYEYQRGWWGSMSASSRVADKTVDQLLKDATPRQDKKKP